MSSAVVSIVEGARPATEADLDEITELAAQAAAELTPLRGGAVWSRLEARSTPLSEGLAMELASQGCLVGVGTIDGAIVGYCAARLVVLHDDRWLCRITDIYVRREARGVGVGEAMMEMLLEWARELRCIGVDSLALPGDRHTKNFFETHGLVARAITVHRSLADDA